MPIRQWVLSHPFPLRRLAAFRAEVLTALSSLFVEEIFRATGARTANTEGGAITFVQRFGGSLNLNVHFHVVVVDGAFERTPNGATFRESAAPTQEAIERVARRVYDRALRWLRRNGHLDDREPEDRSNANEESALDGCARLALFGGGLTNADDDRDPDHSRGPFDAPAPRRFSGRHEGFDVSVDCETAPPIAPPRPTRRRRERCRHARAEHARPLGRRAHTQRHHRAPLGPPPRCCAAGDVLTHPLGRVAPSHSRRRGARLPRVWWRGARARGHHRARRRQRHPRCARCSGSGRPATEAQAITAPETHRPTSEPAARASSRRRLRGTTRREAAATAGVCACSRKYTTLPGRSVELVNRGMDIMSTDARWPLSALSPSSSALAPCCRRAGPAEEPRSEPPLRGEVARQVAPGLARARAEKAVRPQVLAVSQAEGAGPPRGARRPAL